MLHRLTKRCLSLKCHSMGERNKYTEAVVLTVREQGENNRSVCAVSPETGIFYATLYGGPKSKMKSLVQPFNSGIMFIYDDENRKLKKISDFDVKNFHTSLKESLYKMWAANLAAEILMKTKCAGDDRAAYMLLKAFIDGLDAVDETSARAATVRFLWRYLSLLGVQPDTESCISCSQNLPYAGENSLSFYSPASNGFLCRECAGKPKDGLTLSVTGEALHYLHAISTQTPGSVRRLPLSAESCDNLRRITFYLIEQAAGTRLLSLKSGYGIL